MSHASQTILSDGKPISVRALGIFELDAIPRPDGRPFTYEMELLGGKQVEAEFDLDAWDEPPVKPDISPDKIQERSEAWYDLRTWQVYQAALRHRHRQAEELLIFCDAVAEYIVRRCLDPADVPRIVTEADWEEVYTLALVPQLSKEKLAEALRQTYQAAYDDDEIFDALEKTSGGRGVVNALRLWENKVMLQMQMTEAEYATLSLDERARKVCALMLDKWLEHLEMDRFRKEQDKKT